jgi:hypothetical protein
MRSFDDKDFGVMKDCLCEEVYFDYSSFRNEPAAKYKSSEYIEKRKISLENLTTQHNLLNIIVNIKNNNMHANVKCNYIIYRFTNNFSGDKNETLHSYGQYQFELIFQDENWRICSLIQTLTANDGNLNIHKGIKSS